MYVMRYTYDGSIDGPGDDIHHHVDGQRWDWVGKMSVFNYLGALRRLVGLPDMMAAMAERLINRNTPPLPLETSRLKGTHVNPLDPAAHTHQAVIHSHIHKQNLAKGVKLHQNAYRFLVENSTGGAFTLSSIPNVINNKPYSKHFLNIDKASFLFLSVLSTLDAEPLSDSPKAISPTPCHRIEMFVRN
eukprot:574320-Amorphochlora_amoeboformis.AAC.2